LPISQGVFWEEIIERSIKNSKTSYRRARSTPSNRPGGWKGKYSSNRRSYDDRRNLDAAISGIHDKQNTAQRYGRSKKDNMMIQGFRRITRKTI
jgi:hypothetical protein